MLLRKTKVALWPLKQQCSGEIERSVTRSFPIHHQVHFLTDKTLPIKFTLTLSSLFKRWRCFSDIHFGFTHKQLEMHGCLFNTLATEGLAYSSWRLNIHRIGLVSTEILQSIYRATQDNKIIFESNIRVVQWLMQPVSGRMWTFGHSIQTCMIGSTDPLRMRLSRWSHGALPDTVVGFHFCLVFGNGEDLFDFLFCDHR